MSWDEFDARIGHINLVHHVSDQERKDRYVSHLIINTFVVSCCLPPY